ncbi:flagella basal body rod protein [Trichococcus palustris]|uniref:Flagella basal body rod protein n=1 Tax=Trichococcus palustris TaxID=140314 RepID=A0A143YZ07_9LACT|nr:flagellar hook-basal body complex protein [Trichococcus palustris]CZR02453.1 flagella basal body rod protein [Trichococcus palustris]SFL13228.1 flagellar basal-body rod protein FlgG [Trichococcus palustris]
MIRSIDTLSHHFNVLQKKQENMSANIANVNTSGYKSQRFVQSTTESFDFSNYLDGPEANQKNAVGSLNFGDQIDEAYSNLTQGSLRETSSGTDMALMGDAFFTVQAPDGQQYVTRNGNFTVNETGELVTQDGYLVLGVNNSGQTTTIPAGTSQFTVDQAGNVSGTGVRFLLSDVTDPKSLQLKGDTLYAVQSGRTVDDGSSVYQGYLEGSNADTADEMVNMMQIAREFEANQKVLQTADETLSKAVNEIGKV